MKNKMNKIKCKNENEPILVFDFLGVVVLSIILFYLFIGEKKKNK